MNFKDFTASVKERGFLYQATNLDHLSNYQFGSSFPAYIGFDLTAKSLHVGSLVQIMLLRLFARHGHTPIVLLGGGTTKVGDPSGKDEARQLLNDDQIAANTNSIAKIMDRFLEGHKYTMVNNQEWLDSLGYIPLLRDYGRHFSVNRMLSFESVKRRLEREQNLSLLEFNYMVLQSIDFIELYRRYGCRLQMGGSDQWGNIVAGIELGHKLGTPELYGITTPLITTAQGTKMGKTAQGAVWLDPTLLSPYDYWQFWRNTSDEDVGRFLRLFTDLSLTKIEELEKLRGQETNHAKIVLADAATTIAHGDGVLDQIHKTTDQLFSINKFSPNFHTSNDTESLAAPQFYLSPEQIGISLIDLLVLTGLVSSKSEARRLIRSHGVALNNTVITEEMHSTSAKDFSPELKISIGKKRHLCVRTKS